MGKELTFSIGGSEYISNPTKVDRKKLYGWSEKLALDDDGAECSLVSMDESGTVIIPKGGTSLGILSPDGKWIERSQIKTVRLDGSPVVLNKSSYSTVNVLEKKATAENLLDCSVAALYHLACSQEMISAVGNDIYTFDYCYRDSFETNPAFLLTSELEEQRHLFMLIGSQNGFGYIGLDEISIADDNDLDGDEEDSDEIDFSMF